MKKRKYAVSMDEEIVEAIRPHLKKCGISLSGFMNAAAGEYFEIMQDVGNFMDISKMPVSDFLNKLQWMLSKMREDDLNSLPGGGPVERPGPGKQKSKRRREKGKS